MYAIRSYYAYVLQNTGHGIFVASEEEKEEVIEHHKVTTVDGGLLRQLPQISSTRQGAIGILLVVA